MGWGGSAMSEKVYDVPGDWRKRAYVDEAKYQEMYARSINDPNGFWAEQAKRGDQTAILWEGDDPKIDKKLTYKELHAEVCRFANVLKARGVKKGDRVTIYLPMITETAVAMLACARIGAIHSVVFGGFSPDSLAGRIDDCKSDVVITASDLQSS